MHALHLASFAALALSAAPALPAQPAPADTAQLRRDLAAALGDGFEVVRTEVHTGLRERAGTFWLAHVRPLRSGSYLFRYSYHYHDPHRPASPQYTHAEHTAAIRVGEAGCARRRERWDVCAGEVLVLPVVAGGHGGHVFELEDRGPAAALPAYPAWEAAPAAAAVHNPAAPHLRFVGSRAETMPHRSLGYTTTFYAEFEAVEPGRFNLSLGREGGEAPAAGSIPVVVLPRGAPVTVLLGREQVRHSHAGDGFAAHTGNEYATDLLLLQPGDRVALPYGSVTVRGQAPRQGAERAEHAPPAISVHSFHLEVQRRFNGWVAGGLPDG